MKFERLVVVGLLLVLCSSAALVAAEADKRLVLSDAGYSLVLPDGWTVDTRSKMIGEKPSGRGLLISKEKNSDFIKISVDHVDMSAKELADSCVRDMAESIKKMPKKDAEALSVKPEPKEGVDLGWAHAEKFVIPTGPAALMLSYIVIVDKKAYQCSLFVTSENAKEYEAVLDALVKSLQLEKQDVKDK